MKNPEPENIGEFALWLLIAAPDVEKRAELLNEWLKLWKVVPRLE